jgi:putative aldouronate transport system substrate-binding protein
MNKKILLRMLSLILVFSLLVMTSVSCSQTVTPETTAAATAATTAAATEATTAAATEAATAAATEATTAAATSENYFPLAEPVTIKAFAWDDGFERNRVVDLEVAKRTNIDFQWDLSSNDIYDRMDVMMASGDLPDVFLFPYCYKYLDLYNEKGIFLNLDEWATEKYMPNYSAAAKNWPFLRSGTSRNGHQYAVGTYSTEGSVGSAYYYRGDLLEKYGLKVPTTVSEVIEVSKTVQKNEPGMYGFNSPDGWAVIWKFQSLWRTTFKVLFNADKKKYEFGAATPEFKNAMIDFKRFYDAGIINPEINTITNEKYQELYVTGKIFSNFGGYFYPELDTQLFANVPGATWVAGPVPKTDTGVQGMLGSNHPYSEWWMIGVNANTKYPEQIVRFLDWQLSPESIELYNWGIEGDTFTKANGVYKYADKIKSIDNPAGQKEPKRYGLATSGAGIWPVMDTLNLPMPKIQKEFTAIYKSMYNEVNPGTQINYPVLSAADTEKVNQITSNLDDLFLDGYWAFIKGEKNMDADWDAFIAKCAALGTQEAVDVYQAAYEKLTDDQKVLFHADFKN